MTEQTPSLLVKQRMLRKKTQFQCDFFEGYATVTYDDLRIAEETYKKMKAGRQKVKLKGNIVWDYRKGKTAREIKALYLIDIFNAMKKNGLLFNVTYEEINNEEKGGNNEVI